ncbi:MAG: hypothetical protein JWO54_149 [Candidatus Saccharibacteria bacterium]|nr:hypothetical protein [Candidatus Saccharibacteria bacterium]MDB5180391.1 hypothetical protein [Candidatus Saccharibacteria bacterium]
MSENISSSAREPIELLDCDGLAFGHAIALEMSESMSFTPEVTHAVATLRSGVLKLLESPTEADKEAAAQINSNFRINDQYTYNKAVSGTHRLGEQPILDWLAGADDAAFVKLAQWNVERRRSLEAQLAHDHDKLVELSIKKVLKLMELGFFPGEALRRVRLAAETFPRFKAMDSFEAGALQEMGHFDTEDIVLANLYALATEQNGISINLEKIAFHELLHASGCVSKGGFIYQSSSPLEGRVFEEFFVTHSTEVAFSGRHGPQVEVFNPYERIGGTDHIYAEERKAIGLLSSPQLANIPADSWANAFFSNYDSNYQRMVASQLKIAFTALYDQPNALEDFSKSYEDGWISRDASARSSLFLDLEKRVAKLQGRQFSSMVEHELSVDDIVPWAISIPA